MFPPVLLLERKPVRTIFRNPLETATPDRLVMRLD